jgi:hypothetical protein
MNTGADATTVTVTYYDTATRTQVGTPFTSGSLAPNAFLGVYQLLAGPTRWQPRHRCGDRLEHRRPVCCDLQRSSSTTFMCYDGQ